MSEHTDRGITLVDLAMLLAIVGVLASLALPSYQSQLAHGRRSEAISALLQVQAAQEQYRQRNGSYALRTDSLQGLPPRGANYEVTLVASHANGYIARAQSTAGSRDDGCAELTLAVHGGVATHSPSNRCWNR